MHLKKNLAGQRWKVFAFDRTNNEPVLFDAANITANIRKDYGDAAATNDVNPTEIEDGYYEFVLTASESDCDVAELFPQSSTSNVQVIAVPSTVIFVEQEVDEPSGLSGSGSSGSLGNYYYGTLSSANTYFDNRLHEYAWRQASVADRAKSLKAATDIIDALNFKGNKHAVHELLQSSPNATQEEIRVAEASQPLEFPRGADTEVPEAIQRACFEIAHALLDGKDPELELENLAVVSQGYASVRTTYSRTQTPIEHIINGVPSAAAWRWLKPFLRDDDAIRLSRVS